MIKKIGFVLFIHSDFHVGLGVGKKTLDTYTVKGKKGIKPGNGGDSGIGGIGGKPGSCLIIALNGEPDILSYARSGIQLNHHTFQFIR